VEAYTVPGWPRAVLGHSAVTPALTRPAGSGSVTYKDGVTGWPGTQAIPVQPPRVPSPDVGDLAMAGTARSSDAPDVIRPNLYWARPQAQWWPGAGMPVSYRSDNLMPVPATDPRGIPARLAVPLNLRGSRQVRAVRSPVSWPPYG
jgi:hypothetical protein